MNTLDRKGQTGLDATINIMLLPVYIIFVIFFSGGVGWGGEKRGRKGEGGEGQAFFFSFCNLYGCSCTSRSVQVPPPSPHHLLLYISPLSQSVSPAFTLSYPSLISIPLILHLNLFSQSQSLSLASLLIFFLSLSASVFNQLINMC